MDRSTPTKGAALEQELDDKNEEINKQWQYVDKLKERIMDQEELIANRRKNYKIQQAETTMIDLVND